MQADPEETAMSFIDMSTEVRGKRYEVRFLCERGSDEKNGKLTRFSLYGRERQIRASRVSINVSISYNLLALTRNSIVKPLSEPSDVSVVVLDPSNSSR